jgi:hypothetical protein
MCILKEKSTENATFSKTNPLTREPMYLKLVF